MITTNNLLDDYLNNRLEQIFCEKCMNTFLTNIYDLDTHVLLEKFSLGLEYYRDAINKQGITKHPEMMYIGAVDDQTGEPISDDKVKLFQHEEPSYRLIYTMEKLMHLAPNDELFFTEHLYDIDWLNDKQSQELWAWVGEKYNPELAEDIRRLCLYYRQNKDYITWDLHGDNLMTRPSTGEIVILDPYTLNY